jgi:hypothetical protein
MRVQRIRDPFKRYLQKRPFESFLRLHVCRACRSAAPPTELAWAASLPAALQAAGPAPATGNRLIAPLFPGSDRNINHCV